MADTIYTCPECSSTTTSGLTGLSVVTCRQCGAIVFCSPDHRNQVKKSTVPPDWSFIQIGSTFTHENQLVKVVGRIRLQLRNDYKNFWTGELRSGNHVWLMESFASLAVMDQQWTVFSGSAKKLHAGSTIKLTKELSLKGEFVEKCEGVSYEGKIGTWNHFLPGFFFTQASSADGAICVFTIDRTKDVVHFLKGVKSNPDKLFLQNILTWDEWK